MKDPCCTSRVTPSRTGMACRSPQVTPSTSLHVRVLRSNSKLPKTLLSDLPDELLLYLLKFLPLSDLQSIYRISKQFKWLLDSTPRIWASASVVGRWPSTPSELKCFNKIADFGNLEATIKLGIAHLYSEGVESSQCKDGSRAAKYFTNAEKMAPSGTPFTWLFIRPPWSNSGTCCKARVFHCMKDLTRKTKEVDRSVLFSLAKLHSFLEEMDVTHRHSEGSSKQSDARQWLQKAAEKGSVAARYELWKNTLTDITNDTATNLNTLRQLREFTSQGCLEAKLRLYSEYAKGNRGGLSEACSQEAIRGFVRDSEPTGIHTLLRTHNGLTSAMRYILVDWLVEVGSMKDYSCLTIHSAVQLVDRYLLARTVDRATLQLVGITCMVICSRLLEDDIITIREAAWLTDGTYKYEDVVRMLGDVVATLKGNLRDLTILDYLHLFCLLVAADRRMEYLALYISELCLLHADFGQYSRAHVAASALFLARLIIGVDWPWPATMLEHTGFELKDLVPCALHLHNKCFFDDPVLDHRDVTLAAVKQRFSEELFLLVGKMEVMDHHTLRTMLCVEQEDDVDIDDESNASRTTVDAPASSQDGLDAFLLMSPSRKARGKSHHRRPHADYSQADRADRVSTPTHEFPEDEELLGDIKPIDKDALDAEVHMDFSEHDKDSEWHDAKDHHRPSAKSPASWSVLDESSSISLNHNNSSSSCKGATSSSTTSSSSSSLKDIPSTSSSFPPLSSPKTKNQVTYTISASGRLCQQRVKNRKVVSSPVSSRSCSSAGGALQQKLTPAAARYQFRQRTPVQSFKRKTMDDSSDSGGQGH